MTTPSTLNSDRFRSLELFATSRYSRLLSPPQEVALLGTRKVQRHRIRSEIAALPGVYGILTKQQQLDYVGMSRVLPQRLATYFSTSTARKRERRIVRGAKTIIWQHAAHPVIALLRERELIQACRPVRNVQGRPSGIVWGYIVEQGAIAPSFALHRVIPRNHTGLWGPVPYTKHVKYDVEQLNLHFQLRDCAAGTPFYFSGSSPGPEGRIVTPCLRADLQTCLAPCLGACSKRSYFSNVTDARQFLSRGAGEELQKIEVSMRNAAQNRQFERAAVLRNRLQSMERLQKFLKRFHRWSNEATFIYPIQSELDQKIWWLYCLRGVVVQTTPAPHTATEKAEARKQIEEMQDSLKGTSADATVTTAQEFAASRLLFRWFRKYPEQTSQRLTLSQAKTACRVRKKS
jgi:excinuclease ABC subunit C